MKNISFITLSTLISLVSVSIADIILFRPISGGYLSQSIHEYNTVDFGASLGTPIYAAASGQVSDVFNDDGGPGSDNRGNFVYITHNSDISTAYFHAQTVLVTQGQHVAQGELIAHVGSTGFSTGPHLHFEVRGAENPFANTQDATALARCTNESVVVSRNVIKVDLFDEDTDIDNYFEPEIYSRLTKEVNIAIVSDQEILMPVGESIEVNFIDLATGQRVAYSNYYTVLSSHTDHTNIGGVEYFIVDEIVDQFAIWVVLTDSNELWNIKAEITSLTYYENGIEKKLYLDRGFETESMRIFEFDVRDENVVFHANLPEGAYYLEFTKDLKSDVWAPVTQFDVIDIFFEFEDYGNYVVVDVPDNLEDVARRYYRFAEVPLERVVFETQNTTGSVIILEDDQKSEEYIVDQFTAEAVNTDAWLYEIWVTLEFADLSNVPTSEGNAQSALVDTIDDFEIIYDGGQSVGPVESYPDVSIEDTNGDGTNDGLQVDFIFDMSDFRDVLYIEEGDTEELDIMLQFEAYEFYSNELISPDTTFRVSINTVWTTSSEDYTYLPIWGPWNSFFIND